MTCGTSKGWLFAGLVPAGKYRAEIEADYAGSPFKAGAKLLAAELMIQGDDSSYTLNASAAVKISGEVTHNGQPIANNSLPNTERHPGQG